MTYRRYGYGYFGLFFILSKVIGAATIGLILLGVFLYSAVVGNGPSTSPAGAAATAQEGK